jgi:hypothetical protein
MQVFNQSVPVEFFDAFAQLVRNSTLHAKAGTITLSTDWATMELCASFTEGGAGSAKPVGRGATPNGLFALALASIDARPMPSAVPQNMKHPGPGLWWWLSFCDSFKPEGQQFLGVAIVEGKTLRAAIETAEALGIHPGGRVASVACTLFVPAAAWRNRLLSREEVIAAGNSMEAIVA